MSEKKYKTFADLKLVPVKVESDEQSGKNPLLTTGATGVSAVTGVTPVTADTPVAPVKNFQKVTNTITKEAIPNGIFKSGKCKQLYDVLYSLTRGAMRPSRITQVSKPKLRQMSDISSEKTLNANLLNLQLAGLIKVSTDLSGKHGGNIYEVLTPEELPKPSRVTDVTPVTPATPVTHVTSDIGGNSRIEGQIISPVTSVETTPRTSSSNSINMEDIRNSKTLIKTNKENIDDERYRAAFKDLEKVLNQTVANLTGREARESDSERWKQVADILAAQLELIASRTTISNAPAVLAEHLHRQLNSQRALERMGLMTPKEARAAKKESLRSQSAQTEKAIPEETTSEETIPDLYLCPDCDGTTYWNPDGQGRQAGCPHTRLEEARERAAREDTGT